MSDGTADYPARLNLADIVARVERSNAETQKFVAEQRKLAAEQAKLTAEAAKITRERVWFPFQVGVAFMAAGGALVAGTVALLRLVGG